MKNEFNNFTVKQLRVDAKNAGKELIYNRSLGAYQIKCGFDTSEPEYPARNESGKLCLTKKQVQALQACL